MGAQYNQSARIIQHSLTVDDAAAGLRLDQALGVYLPDFSRSRIQAWIRAGFVRLNADSARPRDKVHSGDEISLDVPETTQTFDRAEAIEFDIVFQDDHLFVIGKPAGLVVHPAVGHESGTLVNGLLFHDPQLEQLPRAGIVHRLDKDTTGLMVVARTLPAHSALVAALQARTVKREYVAVVRGLITAGRSIDEPIGRHPVDRKRMAVQRGGKPAITHFTVRERFRAHTLIDVQLETGRTHQIRVHLAHLRHPLVGDPVYGGRLMLPSGIDDALARTLHDFRRQALHARRLAFNHPVSGEPLEFDAPLPADLQRLIDQLRTDAERNHE